MHISEDKIYDYILWIVKEDDNLYNLIDEEKKKIPDVYEHSWNVMKHSVTICRGYNFNLDTVLKVGIGALFHDIGKLDTDMGILYKPSKLTVNEFALIKSHSVYGYNIMRNYTKDEVILDIVLSHHEKLDKSGYPFGDSEISIYTQIVTISDIYDALVSPRVYKKAMSKDEAFDILMKDKGLNFIAVDIFKASIKWY